MNNEVLISVNHNVFLKLNFNKTKEKCNCGRSFFYGKKSFHCVCGCKMAKPNKK